MLTEGDTAPAFTLPGTSAEEDVLVKEYSLDDALANGPVVVNFYLFDFHPACTEQLCSLDNLSWFDIDEDITVFGLSTDRTFSHRRFAESEDIEFTLLSDSDGSVAESFGVLYDEFEQHRLIAKRSVFVVDADRRIEYAWSAEDPAEQPDWAEVSEVARGLLDDGSR